MAANKLRCMTCHKEYEPEAPTIHARLEHFEDWCICRDCVDIYLKRKPPDKGGGD